MGWERCWLELSRLSLWCQKVDFCCDAGQVFAAAVSLPFAQNGKGDKNPALLPVILNRLSSGHVPGQTPEPNSLSKPSILWLVSITRVRIYKSRRRWEGRSTWSNANSDFFLYANVLTLGWERGIWEEVWIECVCRNKNWDHCHRICNCLNLKQTYQCSSAQYMNTLK